MAYVKWGAILVVLGLIGAFFHHYLPSQDIVRIVRTETVRVDVDATDAQGNPTQVSRDQNRIYAFRPDGAERVYRNEDTGWGFPWYFKFDTANLAAAAEDAVSTKADPRWYVVNHYGWRIPLLSMFPNAISMRPAESQEESLFPWFNVIFFVVLIVTILFIRRVLIILRQRHVDPVVDQLDQDLDDGAGWLKRQWRKLSGK